MAVITLASRIALVLISVSMLAVGATDPGSYDEATRVYRNATYAFTCKVPAGWVLRTEQLQPDSAADNKVLLAAFERPPEAASAMPVATILIASESQSEYPGLKTAEEYFAPLFEVVKAKGFKAENDPYSFPVGLVKVAREDFAHEQKDRATTYQSTLVVLSHGVIVSFTFLGASEDDVDGLIEGLAFVAGGKGAPKVAAPKKAARPN
jgi:hypothetical protein